MLGHEDSDFAYALHFACIDRHFRVNQTYLKMA